MYDKEVKNLEAKLEELNNLSDKDERLIQKQVKYFIKFFFNYIRMNI